MTLKSINDEFVNNLEKLNPIIVPWEKAWQNSTFTDLERDKDGHGFYDNEDITDEQRKAVFLRSILHYIQDKKWNTDIINSTEDVDTESKNCKILVMMNGGMFPNYIIYLAKYKETIDSYRNNVTDNYQNLWKTDNEFLKDCIDDIIERMDCGNNFFYFVNVFNDNDYGITFSYIKENPKAKQYFMDAVFKVIEDTTNNKYDED